VSPEKGAETIIYLASSHVPVVISGAYFVKCQVVTPSSAAQDDQAARRLWQESLKLTGLEDISNPT